MNTKKNTFIAFLLFTLLCGGCKNKAIDYSSFEIEEEQIRPETNSVYVSGTYSFLGEVHGMKFNIGLNEKLSDAIPYTMNLDDCDFSVSIDSLKPNTTYYYCYSIDFDKNDDYFTDVNSFTTLQGVPTVNTLEVLAITDTTCSVKGKVVLDNGSPITERGVYWNTTGHPNPSSDMLVKHSENAVGEFTCFIGSLNQNTKYFVYAYAKNSAGMGLGQMLEFQTELSVGLPIVTTADVSEITAVTATSGGEIIDDGQSPVTLYGVCWSTKHNPTIDDSHTNDGSGMNAFISHLDNLIPDTTYYVRAYATNAIGMGYGNEVSFITLSGLPEAVTLPVTDIGINTAKAHGTVIDEGASTVTERGFCWGLNPEPDFDDNHLQNGSGLGDFSVDLTGLLSNRTYYVRAYAKNAQGTAYGNDVNFRTLLVPPTLTLDSVGSITASRAIVYGTLINDDGVEIAELGVCWGTNANPNASGSHIAIDVVSGAFSITIDGLSSGTTYYVRTYAIIETDTLYTLYSSVSTFLTTVSLVFPPTVSTHDEVTEITLNSAVCGGYVSSDGGAPVTARGLCWSTSPGPTINNSNTIDGTGTGDFTGVIDSLSPGTTYYVKAYATNSVGTNYGEQRVFTTSSHPEGALNGLFSVGYNKQVWFSMGNLQYLATTNTWRFTENQEMYAGTDNNGMQEDWNKWIDLFGWGTSNYNHGANNYRPWSTSSVYSNYYAYGQPEYHLYEQSGKADWGYNAISNGGNEENMGWRTLTYLEWNYLLNERQTSSGILYAKAKVNDVCGLIILPDNWNKSIHNFALFNSPNASFGSNTLNAAQWAIIENAGAVFLPAGGSRYGREISNLGSVVYYWSSSNNNGGSEAYYLYVGASEVSMKKVERSFGRIVRLVFDKP